MNRILALDLGTRTGWATWFDGRRHSGVQVFDVRRGESPGMRFLRLHRWLVDMPRPELVIYEQAHHRGGAATAVAVGFVSHVLSFCAQHEIEHQAVHTSTLKKWTTGRGNADKEEMVRAVLARFLPSAEALRLAVEGGGKPTLSDDEADAIALLEYAKVEFLTPVPDEDSTKKGGSRGAV